MKIIKNNIIPFKGFTAINIFGVLFVRKDIYIFEKTWKRIINHESIHTEQMKELLYIPFYLLYIIEFSVRLLMYFNLKKAYKNICFEREAYRNDSNPDYLKARKRYSFFRYILK